MSSVTGANSATLMTAAGIEQLVKLSTTRQQQTVTQYQTKLDDLEVKRGIYGDIQTKLTELRSAVEALRGDDGSGGVLNNFSATVSGDKDALSATVNSSSNAAAGSYSITVGKLATVDRYASYRFSDTESTLNISGAVTLTGAANRGVSNINAGDSNAVDDFGKSSSIRDDGELASGQYYVEVRQSGDNWQFRLVDSAGAAVSIDDAALSGEDMSSDWQNIEEVAGSTFNTGRGLTVSFEDFDPDNYTAVTKDSGAATVQYTQSGSDVTIDVAAGDTLEDIRDAINAVSYVDEKAVEATIVDNRLVVSSVNSGEDSALTGYMSMSLSGGAIGGGGLGFYDAATDENGDGEVEKRHLETAQNAELTVNGLEISRSSNAISDIIDGVTLNLAAVSETGSSSALTVAKDNNDVVNKVKSLLKSMNGAISHLKLKTEPQLDNSGDSAAPTYSAAPLGSDYSMKELRHGLSGDLLSSYSGAASSAFDNLYDLGIEVGDDNVSFELADSQALTDALDEDFASVSALFEHVLGRLAERIDTYTNGSNSIIAMSQDGLDDQLESVKNRKDSASNQLARMEALYRDQYYQMQATLLQMQYEYQNTMSMFTGSANLLNQQG